MAVVRLIGVSLQLKLEVFDLDTHLDTLIFILLQVIDLYNKI